MSDNLPARLSVDDAVRVGEIMASSGFFKDASQVAQAVTKIIAGRELGLGPMASMSGLHVVDGKVVLSANVIAGLIKQSARYDYHVVIRDDTRCVIEFKENGVVVGEAEFTMADAKRAGLDGRKNWRLYPRAMCFARAMSEGARTYCPDVFAGPVYVPGEIEPEPEDSKPAVAFGPVTYTTTGLPGTYTATMATPSTAASPPSTIQAPPPQVNDRDDFPLETEEIVEVLVEEFDAEIEVPLSMAIERQIKAMDDTDKFILRQFCEKAGVKPTKLALAEAFGEQARDLAALVGGAGQ